MADPLDPPDEQRLNRNWTELVQEIRATQTGVQILTAFLLALPFTDRFAELDDVQQASYLVVMACSVATTGVVLAPVAFHRILFRRRRRPWLVEAANQCARAGLILLAFTMAGVMFLVFDLVVGRVAALAAVLAALVFFVVVWGVAPLVLSGRSEGHGGRGLGGGDDESTT
ncbi:MAG: DUF6328 family protein [Aeromicrobium sp.]